MLILLLNFDVVSDVDRCAIDVDIAIGIDIGIVFLVLTLVVVPEAQRRLLGSIPT